MASVVDYEGEKPKRKVLADSDVFYDKIPLNCKRPKLFAIREFPVLFGQYAVKSTYDDDSEEELIADDDSEEELIADDGEDDNVEPDVDDDDVGPDMDYYDDVGFDMDDDNDVQPAMDDDDDDNDVELAVDDVDEPNIYDDFDDDEEDENAEPYEAENLDIGDELLKVLDNEV